MARLDQLRLRDLLVLETIDALGTLHATAGQLHISQPAVSQIVKGLEAAFGTALLVRGQRGVTLTAAGRAALDHLRVARHALEAARTAARAPQAPVLRLGTLPLAMLHRVPAALGRLRERLPGVRVRLVESTVDALWEQLHEGRMDAIVSRLPTPKASRTRFTGIVHQTIGQEPIVLVAPRKHPAARLRRPTLADLTGYDWILPNPESFTRATFDTHWLKAGLVPPAPAMTCAAFHSSLHLAARVSMLTVVPASAVALYARSLDLVALRIDWPEQDADIVFACREASLTVPALAALRDSFLEDDR